MIPKVIHYFWFGHGKMPKMSRRCMDSWRKFFPDYEIKEWNEDNFDVNILPYTTEAYRAKKYAFVSDYARFWVLYNYGGIYFDIDVEVLKPMDAILQQGSFMSCETSIASGKPLYVNPGIGFACEPKHPFIKECLDIYNNQKFVYGKGGRIKTVCEYVTELLQTHGLQQVDEIQRIAGLTIYPWDYMCPMSTEGRVVRITENTVSIHYFAGTWGPSLNKLKKRTAMIIGPNLTLGIIKIKRIIRSLLRIKI